jgi:hypothetical protein
VAVDDGDQGDKEGREGSAETQESAQGMLLLEVELFSSVCVRSNLQWKAHFRDHGTDKEHERQHKRGGG